MKSKKQVIVAICLSAGLTQAPAANAQVQAAAPLIQLGVQLASQLVPMVLPVVIGGTVMGVRAGMMLPSYVKERMPHPRLRGKKKVADASTAAPEAALEQADNASENVSGTIIDESQSSQAETSKAAAPVETAVEEEHAQAATEQVEHKQSAPAKQRRAPKDASEWYMEED